MQETDAVNDDIYCLTCVLPPELSCTAVLESAVLAANDLKLAPNMLLTPNAMSSWGGNKAKSPL